MRKNRNLGVAVGMSGALILTGVTAQAQTADPSRAAGNPPPAENPTVGATPTMVAVFSISPVHADEEGVTMVGLEVHASSSMTIGDADRISRYFLHNIAKWSPGAAMVLDEGDSRGGGAKVDLNVVIYISKLGKAYSFFVETTDEVALRKELTEKGISRADVDALLGDPKS